MANLTHSDFHDRGRGNHIENEAAYAAAIVERRKANARKTNERKWFEADSSRIKLIERVRLNAPHNAFMAKMLAAYEEWFSLTPGQEKAVREIFAKKDARKAERVAGDLGSKHIGTVDVRQTFKLTVRSITRREDHPNFVVMVDAEGNVVIYSGSSDSMERHVVMPSKTYRQIRAGDVLTVKAAVKKHTDYHGVKQTEIRNPSVLTVEPGREPEPKPEPEAKAAPEPEPKAETKPKLVNWTEEGVDVVVELKLEQETKGRAWYDNAMAAAATMVPEMRARLLNGLGLPIDVEGDDCAGLAEALWKMRPVEGDEARWRRTVDIAADVLGPERYNRVLAFLKLTA
jgi:hypothetical protein